MLKMKNDKDITKVIDLGHGITKTITVEFIRTDEYGRDIYGNKVTDYGRNGITVRVIEYPWHTNYGRENAHVYIVGGEGRARSYKDNCNAHAKAYEMLIEATR